MSLDGLNKKYLLFIFSMMFIMFKAQLWYKIIDTLLKVD